MQAVHIQGISKNPGHYAPGMISKGMLYVSGQLPKDLFTGKIIDGSVEEQTLQALKNVELVCQAAGCELKNIVLCHVYISDMANWDRVNKVYADYFGAHMPARVVVPTRELHFGAMVEIEATAEIPEK